VAGPYGEWGSRKYLLASLDASLKRLKLDYVDIFYHHRRRYNTPLEETMGALDQAVNPARRFTPASPNYRGGLTPRRWHHRETRLSKPIIHQPNSTCSTAGSRRTCCRSSNARRRRDRLFAIGTRQLSDKYLNGIPPTPAPACPADFSSRPISPKTSWRRSVSSTTWPNSGGQSLVADGAGMGASVSRGDQCPDRRSRPSS